MLSKGLGLVAPLLHHLPPLPLPPTPPSPLLPKSSFISKPFVLSVGPPAPNQQEQTLLSGKQVSKLLAMSQIGTTSEPGSPLLGMESQEPGMGRI